MKSLLIALGLLVCASAEASTLTWDLRQSTEEQTTVERAPGTCMSDGLLWSVIATLPTSQTSYVDNEALTPGQPYCYRVNMWFTLSILKDFTVPAVPVWAQCAVENEFCSFTGVHDVRYGDGTNFCTVTALDGTPAGGVSCANTLCGDPSFGVVKHCDVR